MRKLSFLVFLLLIPIATSGGVGGYGEPQSSQILTDCGGIHDPGVYIITGEILHNRHIGSCFKVYTDNVRIVCQNANIIGDVKTAFEVLKVENVTIENCHASGFSYGARLYYSKNITLRNNNFVGNNIGVILVKSESNLIEGNYISHNDVDGLKMKYSYNNVISGNTFNKNLNSINMLKTSENVFENNNIVNNGLYGVNMYFSSQNKIKENFICENNNDFRESFRSVNEFISNTCDDPLRCEFSCGLDCVDVDMDGYYSTDGCGVALDCDDSLSLVYPTAREICSNGIDNDCDGLIDENCDFTVTTTTSTTTTTLKKTGTEVICDTQSTSCYHSCKRACPDEFDYCNIEFIGRRTFIGTVDAGDRLPWAVSPSKMSCFMEGVYL